MADELNIFSDLFEANSVTKYTLFRGVTDYTRLQQFDLYESGYSFLICLSVPKFLEALAEQNANVYKPLLQNYRHIIEYEFRGAQGIEDITTETSPLSNGITDVNVITRVTEQGGTQFSLNYFERSGSIITRLHELYLRGIKDPRTQVKRYNGLLTQKLVRGNSRVNSSSGNKILDKGYHQEIFNYLLIVTDNTALNIEKAYLLAACQPSMANTSIYNVTRGEIAFQEMQVQWNGLPIPGKQVYKKARDFLDYINEHTCFDEMEFQYGQLNDATSVANVEKENSAGATFTKGKAEATS